MVIRECLPMWQIAAVLFGGLGLLQAWDSLEAQRLNLTPTYAARARMPTSYCALSRTEIMLSEAGQFLN